MGSEWEIGVLVGPHSAPDFLTPAGLVSLLSLFPHPSDAFTKIGAGAGQYAAPTGPLGRIRPGEQSRLAARLGA